MNKTKRTIGNQPQKSILTLQDFLQKSSKNIFISEYSLIFICLESIIFLNLIIRLEHTTLSTNNYTKLFNFQILIFILFLIFRAFCPNYKYKIYKIISGWIIILFIYSLFKFIIFLIITIMLDSYQILIYILNNQSKLTIEILFLFFIYFILFFGTLIIFSIKTKTFKGKILTLEFIVVFLSFVLVLLFLYSLFIFKEAPYMVISIFIFVFYTLFAILLPFIFIKRVKENENLKYFFYTFSMVKIFLTKIILFKFLTDFFIYEHELRNFLDFSVLKIYYAE